MNVCRKCNLEYDDDFNFCPRCASKLSEVNEPVEPRYCQYCGELVDSDSDYCPYCGKSLGFLSVDVVTNDSSDVVSKSDVSQKASTSNVPKRKIVKKHPVPKEEESTFVSYIKFILYAVGMIFLYFIFQLLISGSVKILRSDGVGLPFIIVTVIAGAILYVLFYRTDD